MCCLIKYIDSLKIMPVTHAIIVRIMRRSNLYCACSKFRINIKIIEDWNLTVNDWQNQIFTNKFFISVILRTNSNTSIPQHSFWTCCCNQNVINAINRFF